MRAESEMPKPQRPGQRSGRFSRQARVVAIVLIVGVLVLLLSLRGIANFYTDYLWFDALDSSAVWRRLLLAKVILAIIFIAIFFAFAWFNLYLAERLAPEFRPPGPEEEVVARYHEMIGGRGGLVRLVIVGLFALSTGASASGQWENWLLFRNRVDFGVTDPHFGVDIGFYVFQLPFLSWVINWLFTAVIITFVLAAIMHYLHGGIRMQTPGERVAPQVKAHLSLLLGVLALIKAADYYLDRFELTTSNNGTVNGLTYTDVNARLPVLSLLILISLFAFVLLVVNIRRRGWVLPALAVGLWAFVNIVMGGLYPVFIQRFQVEPVESTKEAEFIARNINGTKAAFGLGEVENRSFNYDEDLGPDDLQANVDNLRSVPLHDPDIVGATYDFQQAELTFFTFPDEIDVDRYVIDGQLEPVTIGARGLDAAGFFDQTWESETLTFTHGNGIALARANEVEDELPVFLIGDVPLTNSVEADIPVTQPRLYYSEDLDGYGIVNTGRDEVDYDDPVTDERVAFNYDGEGGVRAGGFLRRAMFALRFRSIDPLISDFVTDESKFVYNRDIRDRVETLAPFMHFDHDPYPVVIEGRILFVLDGYTTTGRYPYAQRANLDQLDATSGLAHGFNYVRNSVKAVVDGYDGNVELYVVDPTDPIAAGWRKAFPGLFSDVADMPPGLVDHLRYPEDLFTVQTNMWARYHVNDTQTDALYDRASEWAVAQTPGGVETVGRTTTSLDGQNQGRREARVAPYYQLMRLPGETELEFSIIRTFVPFSEDEGRKELEAIMAGVGELGSENYGRLVSYEMRSGDASGPALVAAKILAQDEISARISLLNADQEGSSVEFGDLIIVPVENSLLYVRPFYVIATSTKEPQLEWIIVAHGDDVVMCHGFAEALQALFGSRIDGVQSANLDNQECIGDVSRPGVLSTPGTSPPPPSSSQTPPTVGDGEADAEALRLLNEAAEALAAGDLGRYQELVDLARETLAGSTDPAPVPSTDDDDTAAGEDAEEDEGDPA